MNLLSYRSQVEENTGYNSWSISRNLRTTMFQTKNKKSLPYYLVFFDNWIVSGHFHLFPNVAKSSATKFTARKEVEWR